MSGNFFSLRPVSYSAGRSAADSGKKRKTPPRKEILDGESEAKIIALACSEPPAGYSRWSIRLLRDKAVELHFVDELSHMTVQRLLKKRNISLT